MYDNSHLTLDERKIIQTGIENGSSKKSIADTIRKDPSTIAKEIKKHRKLRPRNILYYPSICIHNKSCRGCKSKCSRYVEITCSKRDRSPGACNKCIDIPKCHLDKYFYTATTAYDEYRTDLIDFREGINLTTSQRSHLASVLSPLIERGQSIYQIKSSHKEISQCEKTLYNYIDSGVFRDFGINNMSLKEKVSRKIFKNKYKKRKEAVNYEGRKYKDYLSFKENYPETLTVEMDTVMNSLSGPYIQTFMFEKTGFMIGYLHLKKTSESMSNTFNMLQGKFEDIVFKKLFSLILTDRGTEFQMRELFEVNTETGEIRLNIFYCDAMQSSQKPHVENNHNYVRDIIPNGISLGNLTQTKLDLMFSHINSTPRESMNGKTPYEMFEFLYGKETLDILNITQIKRDEVTLKPYLLKTII